jgi:hypothetical protein
VSTTKRPIRTVSGLLAVALAIYLSVPGRAASPDEKISEYQKIAGRFLRALYPEMTGKNYEMSISTAASFDLEWGGLPFFDVQILKPDCTPSRDSQHLIVLLNASFEFGHDGLFSDVHALSSSLEKKYRDMWTLVDAHPEWPDQRVASELAKAGAKFGPTQQDALIQAIPKRALEPVVGVVTVRSAEFRLRHEQTPPVPELYWVIEASAITSAGAKTEWELHFEPFSGKLTDLYRVPEAGHGPPVP